MTEQALQEITLYTLNHRQDLDEELRILSHKKGTVTDLESYTRDTRRMNQILDELEAMP